MYRILLTLLSVCCFFQPLSLMAVDHGRGSRSPFELLNCLASKDCEGLTETLKHISVNTRFTPQGNTALMVAIDLYSQRLKSVPAQFEMDTAIASGALLIGGLAAVKIPTVKPTDKGLLPVPNREPQNGAAPAQNPIHHDHDEHHGFFSKLNPLGGLNHAKGLARAANSIAADVHDTTEKWNAGGIPMDLTGPVAEATAKEINEAALSVRATFHDIRYYMRASAMLACAAASLWFGLKAARQFKGIRKMEVQREQDIATYEMIIQQLLDQDELDLAIKNNAGETAIDMVHRLTLTYAEEREIAEKLLKLERKMLHVIRQKV